MRTFPPRAFPNSSIRRNPAAMGSLRQNRPISCKRQPSVAELIRRRGHKTLIIDVGILGEPKLKPDIPREEIAHAAVADLVELVKKKDRGEAVKAMSIGAPIVLARLLDDKKIDGVISL